MEAWRGWERLVGTWSTEGTHPLLSGDEIRGESTFAWFADQQALLQTTHYDHPQIPDALMVTTVLGGVPTMHYFDPRGEHRVFTVEIADDTWRFWNDKPGFAQRWTGVFSEDGAEIRGYVETCRDGATWDPDIELTYRRVRR